MLSENQNIEYKESWRDEYLKWICGFANAQGGRIYIGVDDKRQIIGTPDAKRLLEDIPNKVVNYLGIVVDVNLLADSGKEYIEIVVAPSNVPIAYKGIYHYRSGSTKQELKGVALQQFIMDKMGHSWDEIPVLGATIEDIDRKAIEFFIFSSIRSGRMSDDDAGATTEDVLRNLGLFNKDGQLKNAAILLFGKHVNQFFPAATFKIGRFHTTESDLIGQDLIDGNLIQMASRVVQTLRNKYLLSSISYDGIQRVEELEIPEKALRELVYNAIAHKDYTGPAIQMRIYDNSIELWNYGLLPKELTPADLLKKHPSYPRNHNIANAFFRAGFVESWGRGFGKIAEEFRNANIPLPAIEENAGGVTVTISRKSNLNVGDMSEINVGDVSETKISERQKIIMSIIQSNPKITAKQMSETLSVTSRTIERDLALLQKNGIIHREGSDNAGQWVLICSTNTNNNKQNNE